MGVKLLCQAKNERAGVWSQVCAKIPSLVLPSSSPMKQTPATYPGSPGEQPLLLVADGGVRCIIRCGRWLSRLAPDGNIWPGAAAWDSAPSVAGISWPATRT